MQRVHSLVSEAFLNHVPCGMKLVIDHINGDKHDNRVDNLQIVSQRENMSKMNGKFSSKYIGVSWDKKANKWSARIKFNMKKFHIGFYDTPEAASAAYRNAALRLHGEFSIGCLPTN